MTTRGRFITLEGGEGAGKSTQAQRLANRLRAKGNEVLLTREPGGTPWAETLRKALISEKGRALSPVEQAVLFTAARADHVDELIAPALAAGKWVVCDRFLDSTEAYQGAGGATRGLTELLAKISVGETMPDLTFILDIDPALGRQRASKRDALDPFEEDSLVIQAERRAAFLSIAQRDKARCIVVNGGVTPQETGLAIWRTVRQRLPVMPLERVRAG